MADSPKKGPPKPIILEDSVAQVASRPNLKRRETGRGISPPPAPPLDQDATGSQAALLDELEAPAIDLLKGQVDDLIRKLIKPLPVDLRAEVSNEHIVFPTQEEAETALAKARGRVESVRAQLRLQLGEAVGPEARRLEETWIDTLAELSRIRVQRDHWAAEPVGVVPGWRRTLGVNAEGDALVVQFGYVAPMALRPSPSAVELESRLLPELLDYMLDLRPAEGGLARALSPEEDGRLEDGVAALQDIFPRLLPAHREHYRGAYHAALQGLATGDPTEPRIGKVGNLRRWWLAS